MRGNLEWKEIGEVVTSTSIPWWQRWDSSSQTFMDIDKQGRGWRGDFKDFKCVEGGGGLE